MGVYKSIFTIKTVLIFWSFRVQDRTEIYGYIMCYSLKRMEEYSPLFFYFFYSITFLYNLWCLYSLQAIYRATPKSGIHSLLLHAVAENIFLKIILPIESIDRIISVSILSWLLRIDYDLPNMHIVTNLQLLYVK